MKVGLFLLLAFMFFGIAHGNVDDAKYHYLIKYKKGDSDRYCQSVKWRLNVLNIPIESCKINKKKKEIEFVVKHYKYSSFDYLFKLKGEVRILEIVDDQKKYYKLLTEELKGSINSKVQFSGEFYMYGTLPICEKINDSIILCSTLFQNEHFYYYSFLHSQPAIINDAIKSCELGENESLRFYLKDEFVETFKMFTCKNIQKNIAIMFDDFLLCYPKVTSVIAVGAFSATVGGNYSKNYEILKSIFDSPKFNFEIISIEKKEIKAKIKKFNNTIKKHCCPIKN